MDPVRRKALLQLLGIFGGLAGAVWVVTKLTKPFEEGMEGISVHPHGEHVCYCPDCGARVTVGESVRCNTQVCPDCGARMRAEDTGEYR